MEPSEGPWEREILEALAPIAEVVVGMVSGPSEITEPRERLPQPPSISPKIISILPSPKVAPPPR